MGEQPTAGWVDVSVPVRSGMVHWPDNPPVTVERVTDVARGDPATVSRLSMGAHTGTHMDAPAHFFEKGIGIDRAPLEAVIGPARIVGIDDPRHVGRDELERADPRPGERLLLKTRNSDRVWHSDEFVEDFVYVSLEAARFLADRRVRTIGIDYLSVGGYHADGEAIHRVLLEAGIWIIEGLDLRAVAPGDYELICLPLKLADADGAPARAVIRARQ